MKRTRAGALTEQKFQKSGIIDDQSAVEMDDRAAQGGDKNIVSNSSNDFRGLYALVGTCMSGCTGDSWHTMNVTDVNEREGTFSGTGVLDTERSTTWVFSGRKIADKISWQMIYTGSYRGYTVNVVGIINVLNSMYGTATDGLGQTLVWKAYKKDVAR